MNVTSIDTISTLRKYRIQLHTQQFGYFNDQGVGIALFDLLATFIVAYILEGIVLQYIRLPRITYYLLLIPLGVLVHIITDQQTFLNSQLFSSPTQQINIYQLAFIMLSYLLLMSSFE